MKTISERIAAIEANFNLPGTQLVRALYHREISWCLSVGEFQGPQWFFYGHTIEDCLTQAEEAVAEIMKR